MTEIDAAELVRLREIAENATPGPWEHCQAFQTVPAERTIHGPVPAQHVDYVQGYIRQPPNGRKQTCIVPMEGRESFVRSNDMAHIAAFDPPTVLAILYALEKARLENAPKILELETYLAREAERAVHHKTACESARAERDSARALLRECAGRLSTVVHRKDAEAELALRARIDKELNSTPQSNCS